MQRCSPARMAVAASMMALSEEPQTLFTVIAGVLTGKLAPKATCRAGF